MANGLGILRTTGCRVWKYAGMVCVWTTRFIKLRYWNRKACAARRELDASASRLGIEIYSLHQAGESAWSKSPLVQQQLKLVEEAESNLFTVQDAIEALDADYRAKKQRISEKCAPKKDEAGGE